MTHLARRTAEDVIATDDLPRRAFHVDSTRHRQPVRLGDGGAQALRRRQIRLFACDGSPTIRQGQTEMLLDDNCRPFSSLELRLPADEIHVWSFRLETPAVATLAELLASDERARAKRFHFERDYGRFVVAHARLRQILSFYTALNPRELQFHHRPYGKPELTESCGGEWVRFNLSHSHELGLCALTGGQELGVDVEWIRALEDLDRMARHFFSALEYEQICALEEEHRLEAFYNCWTRKEAYVKACGDGLARPLDRFDVTLAPGEPARFLSIEGNAREAERWFLHALAPAPGYVGAVALPGQHWRVKCWRWPEEERQFQ